MSTPRRSFVRWTLAGAVSALVAGSRSLPAQPVSSTDPWLDHIAGKKHKAYLDVSTFVTDGSPFRRTRNLINLLKETYKVTGDEIGVAFGAHGTGLAYMLTPAAWDKLGIIAHISGGLRPNEADALRAATRNWGTLGGDNVRDLKPLGVRFLACRQTMGRWSEVIGTRSGRPAADVLSDLLGGLHEGVEVVPAMIMAAVVAQERRVSYVSVS